jgi:hypothetical protein
LQGKASHFTLLDHSSLHLTRGGSGRTSSAALKVNPCTSSFKRQSTLTFEYLLTTKNICTLPLFPVANGEKVTIFSAPSTPVYTRSEIDVFGPCDGSTACVPALFSLFSSPKDGICKEACWTISNIIAGSPHQIQGVIDANLIPPLISMPISRPKRKLAGFTQRPQ